MRVELPGPDSRTVFIGSTGTGKTQGAFWLLSTRDYNNRAWYIIDPKGEKLFKELEKKGALEVDISAPIQDVPGIYIIRPLPGQENELSDFFKRVYYHEAIGILVDEATMVKKNDQWFRALMTQGRSKEIEMII